MRNSKLLRDKGIWAIVLIVIAMAVAMVCLPVGNDAAAALNVDEPVATQYTVGDVFTVPSGTITVDGETYETTHVVRFPGGRTSVAGVVTLDEAGIYTLEYIAGVNGKTVVESLAFTAKEKLLEVTSGRNASVRFGVYGDSDTDYVEGDRSKGLRYPDAEGFAGIRLGLTENAVFSYNKAVNISDLEADDVLFDFIALPAEKGTADLYELQVAFTDAYDPSNQMVVKYQQRTPSSESWSWTLTFVQAKGRNQQFTGIENDVVTVGGESGASGYFAFNGNGRQPVGKEFIRLCYDKAGNRLYHETSRGRTLICDFDDPRFIGLNPWGGFSGDEIFLSLTGRRFNNSPAELLITQIYGQDLTEMAGEYVEGDIAPKLIIDTLGYEELPEAAVGVAYPIFAYEAADAYGLPVRSSVKAYYGYNTSTQFDVDVSNGSFTPAIPGLYVLRYTAVNAFGKSAERTLQIMCRESIPFTVALPDDRKIQGTAGLSVPVSVPVLTGGSGKTSYDVTVTIDGQQTETTDSGFVPKQVGTYTVRYTATDYLGQTATAEYTVSVKAVDKPIFDQTITLPRYFLTGFSYELPTVSATYYATGQTVTAVISAAGGTLTGNTFRADKAGTAVITYTADSNDFCREIPVIDGTKEYVDEFDGETYTGIDSSKYFDTVNMTVTQTDTETTLLTDRAGEAGFTFVNPLYADGFTIAFAIPGGKSGFDGVELVLTDSERSEISLTVGMYPASDGATHIYMNGVSTGNRLTTALTSGSEIRLRYSEDTRAFTDMLGLTQTAESFDGFPSGKVYLQMRIQGNDGNAGLIIKEINAQGINSLPYDSVRPQTKTIDKMPILVEKGETVTIARAIGADVLNPEVSGYVTVQKVDGTYLTASDGTLLSPETRASYSVSRQVIFEEFGTYLVSYVTEDSNGMKASPYNIALRVMDDEAPVLKVNGKVPLSGKVGTPLALPAATASDNVDGEITVSILVIEPYTGHIYNLSSASFTPRRKGYHTVRYYAADANGNIATADYIIGVVD